MLYNMLSMPRARSCVGCARWVRRWGMMALFFPEVKRHRHTVEVPHLANAVFDKALVRVADVLGHSDINTTKKHYAATTEYRLRASRNAVKLREKLPESADAPSGAAPASEDTGDKAEE